jgi:hypothetical protein
MTKPSRRHAASNRDSAADNVPMAILPARIASAQDRSVHNPP